MNSNLSLYQLLKHSIIALICFLNSAILRAQDNPLLLTINKSLEISLNKNTFLKAQKYKIDIAESDIVSARLRPNPIINNQNLQLMNGSEKLPNSSLLGRQNRQHWYQATLPIPLMNQIERKVDFANISLEISKKEYESSINSHFYSVASVWLSVWKSKMETKILTEAKENVDTLVHINSIRLKNEAITPIELVRTQLLSDQLRLQLKKINIEKESNLKDFYLLLGDSAQYDVDENDDYISYEPPMNFDSLYTIAKENRLDYSISMQGIKLAESNVKLQNSLKAPYLELGVVYNPQNGIPYAGTYATISVPLFSKNQGEIQKSQFIVAQSNLNANYKELQIQKEIKVALSKFQLSKANMSQTVSMLLKASTVLNAVRYSYLKGNTSILDFLEAQRTLLETQRTYYDSVYEFRKNYLELLYVIGYLPKIYLLN